MTEREAIAALLSDLHWQIDQLSPRGIRDKAGNPYNPSYYKRGLQKAIERGGTSVADYVRQYLKKPPNDGFKKLGDADSLDLACEALIADAEKPYALLFSDADREAARARLAPYMKSIQDRKAARSARIDGRRASLPADVSELCALAADAVGSEDSIAINTAILALVPSDVVAMNRLGRAYDALGMLDEACATFEAALAADPGNPIAVKRLREMERRRTG